MRNHIHLKRRRLVLCLASILMMGVVQGRDFDKRQTGSSRKDERKEQMRIEASTQVSNINNGLRELLGYAQKNQRPPEEAVENAASVLDESKQYASVLEQKEKAQFMLLQAWTSFYQDNPVQAVSWSMRACKTNEAAQDAWNSQALFCMLNDRRPSLPRFEKPKPQSSRRSNYTRRRNNESTSFEAKPEPYSEKGMLELDLLGLKSRMFREEFGYLKCTAADNSQIEFQPEKDTLCILFWQSEDATKNTPGRTIRQQTDEPAQNYGAMDMGYASDSQKKTLPAQQKYFQTLMDACRENPEIKFVQINTTMPKKPETFLNELPDYRSEPIPTVVAVHPASNAQQFVGLDAQQPFMTIVGKEGKVKYAGTAADFAPAFILTELTGVEIDLEKQAQSAPADSMMMPGQIPGFDPAAADQMMMEMMQGMMQGVQAAKSAADPNRVTNDPNTAAGTHKKIMTLPKFPQGLPKPAAPLRGLNWIKGTPVAFQPGRIYVVEFWATWCPPCRTSIPHLTEIQNKYKDKGVTVIGITDEKEVAKVKQFVTDQGGNMDYTVAIDNSGQAVNDYLRAYGQSGIPVAFVVDGSGRLVWYGHPMAGLEAVLEAVIIQQANTPAQVGLNTRNPGATNQPDEFEALEMKNRAENLLRSAELHINKSRKLRSNPRQGIEDCRKVLAEFPNTEYAQQARELLRRVPERYKQMNDITEQELGY